jgi:uncharacterized membrane protein
MKVVIWVGCLLLAAIVKVLFLRNVQMGALPSLLYYGVFFGAAYYLSWRWAQRKKPSKEADKQA